eukprot:g6778.t1
MWKVFRRVNVFRSFYSSNSGSVPCTSDQLQMISVAENFASREFLPFASQWEEQGKFSIEALRRGASLGFSGICVDPKFGGSGLGSVESSLIFEALSYGDVSTTAFLTVQNMVAYIIDKFGTIEQRSAFLPPLMQLEKFGSYCLTESESGSDAASIKTTAKRIESSTPGFVLNGSKAFISGGGLSEIYVVFAKTGATGSSGISAFLIEKDTPGLSFGKVEKKMGWVSQPTTTVILDSVHVPHAGLLGAEGEGFKIAMHALDRGRVNIAACAIGGAQFCMDTAEQYVKTRKQFGKTINSFQNTQFKLSEMATSIQASRLLVRNAAYALDHKLPSATVDAAMAKLSATEMAVNVSNQSLQLLGGYGYLKDYQIERYVRDLRVMTILEGTNEVMKLIIHKGRQEQTNKK